MRKGFTIRVNEKRYLRSYSDLVEPGECRGFRTEPSGKQRAHPVDWKVPQPHLLQNEQIEHPRDACFGANEPDRPSCQIGIRWPAEGHDPHARPGPEASLAGEKGIPLHVAVEKGQEPGGVEIGFAEPLLRLLVPLHPLHRFGVEAAAAHECEEPIARCPQNNSQRLSFARALQDEIGRCGWVVGKPEISGKHVHRSTGDDRQKRAGSAYPVYHLVDQSVATESDHQLAARLDGASSHLDSGVGRVGLGDFQLEPGFESRLYHTLDRGRHPARFWVHDEMSSHSGRGYHRRALIHDHGTVVAIDSFMHGWEGITAVYFLPAPRPALIETGPASSLEHVLKGLEEAGVTHLEWIILTHIHLDHAGAVGHLSEKFPGAKVVVRVEGAPHLIDPTRLWASASRLYPDMETRWGAMLPVPEERIVAVSLDEQVADLGDGRVIEAIYAPGHAKHQMALLDASNGDLFVGDAIGVWLPDAGVIRPATPPPEFDLESSLETIDKLKGLRAARVFPTHFGPVPSGDPAFDEGADRISQWVATATEVVSEGGGAEEVTEAFRARAKVDYAHLEPTMIEKFEQTTSYALNAAGIVRYLTKRQDSARA